MNEFFANLFKAARGQKDLLAFFGIALVSGWLLTQEQSLDRVLIFAIGLLLAWIGLRWSLVKIHSSEQMRELETHTRLRSLKVLAEHGTKADIRDMIDEIIKAEGGPDAE